MKTMSYAALLTLVSGFFFLEAGPVCSSTGKQIKQESVSTNKTDTIIPTSQLRFAAVGDLMLGTNYPTSALPGNPDSLLRDADSLIRNTDVAFGNIEGVFLNTGGTPKGSGPNIYNFRQPTSYANILKNVGFDILSIANNHINDFGPVGIESTVNVLKDNGFSFAGTPKYPYAIFEKNNLKVGLIAFAPHSGCLDLNNLPAAIELVKKTKKLCDILLVSYHAGAEGNNATHVSKKTEFFYGQNRGNVYEFSHAVIDAGADIVIGHGPHVPRALELYKKRLIAYSLGNFCTYAKFNLKGYCGYAPLLEFMVNRDGEFISGQIHSFIQKGEGGPSFDASGSVTELIKKLSLEDFPGSPLIIHNDGKISVK